MAFRPPKKPPQFADLISVLAQSKNTDNALYQTVQEIINRLEQFVGGAAAISATQATQGPLGGGGGGSTPGPPLGAHAPTHYNGASDPVTITALAGFTGNVANFLRADGTFQPPPTGGVPANHAPTHQPGGADPMQVDAAPSVGSLRTLGNGPNQAAPGNRGPLVHAPTHSDGSTDPVTVTNLAGYPGGTTQFLRADKTFAVPPGGAGGGMNLDYLGDYVASTYNDGDIVIGPDGIAYMCVVDGTTTPPEPWPGVGIAINPAVDATYWTVSNHPQLTNERVMSSLANGYVKSTAGEPSTVAIIPVSEGGTGANNPTTARSNLGIGTVGPINLAGDERYYLNGLGQFAIPNIPSGFIILSAIPCPIGYTRVTQADGRFLVGSTVWGAIGGANTHVHTLTGATTVHNHGGFVGVAVDVTGTSGVAGSHSHTVTATGSAPTSDSIGNSSGADAGGSFTAPYNAHHHDVTITVNGNTNTLGDHQHSIAASGSGGGTLPEQAALAVNGATDIQNNIPLYFTTILCYKD